MFNKINNALVNFMIAVVVIGMWWLCFGGGALGSPSYGWILLLEITK